MANGILAAILSFFIPGLGQAYAGDIKKGIIFFIVLIVLILIGTMIFRSWVISLINIIFSLYAAYDAYQMTQWKKRIINGVLKTPYFYFLKKK